LRRGDANPVEFVRNATHVVDKSTHEIVDLFDWTSLRPKNWIRMEHDATRRCHSRIVASAANASRAHEETAAGNELRARRLGSKQRLSPSQL
jgi:hypothetical protein